MYSRLFRYSFVFIYFFNFDQFLPLRNHSLLYIDLSEIKDIEICFGNMRKCKCSKGINSFAVHWKIMAD